MRSPCGRTGALAPLINLFQYKPLKTSTSIRLLKIVKSDESRISCRIQEFELQEAPPFEALSYTWGDPLTQYSESSSASKRLARHSTSGKSHSTDYKPLWKSWNELRSIGRKSRPEHAPEEKRLVPILCNGSTLMITGNLWNAIRMLRKTTVLSEHSNRSQHVWIDALCINQRDTSERNAQVSLMSRIFERAEGVIAWLGPEDEFTDDAMKVVCSIGAVPEHQTHLPEYTSFFDGETCEVYTKFGIPPLTLRHWLGFIAFINRPWFRRSWVVQELALARKVHLICGSTIVPWQLLERTLNFITSCRWYHHLDTSKLRHNPSLSQDPGIYRKLLRSDVRFGMAPVYLSRTRQRHQASPTKRSHSLRMLMVSHRYTISTDPRDKVFAFLGLADLRNAPYYLGKAIIPDYNIPVQQLYLDTTIALILSHRTLSVLCNVQDASLTKIKGLPSWVPDYSAELTPYPLRYRGLPTWRACRSSSYQLDVSSLDQSRLERGLLPLRGYKIDSISSTADLQSESPSSPAFWSRIVDLASTLPAKYPLTYTSGHTPSRFEVLWRTLMTNTYRRIQPADAACGQLFIDYILNLQIRHSLLPWSSSDLEFRPHQVPGGGELEFPKWQALLAGEPMDSPYGLALYEGRVKDVLERMFKGEYTPLGLAQMQHELDNASGNLRRVFRTQSGLLGTGARSLRVGDEVWVLIGAPVPFVLRPQENGRRRLVGETYVHGIMHGRVLDMGLREEGVVLE